MEQLLRILTITCLLAAVPAQLTFFCNSSNTSSTIRHQEFTLVTTGSRDITYPPGLVCEFNAETTTDAFLVEIQSFQVNTAVVTIVSGGIPLFRGSSIQKYQMSFVTPAKSLQVRFDATGDYSRSAGVSLRVRAFDSNGCPPGWVYLHNKCFGTSNTTGRLDYFDAQRACNNMRSNLLHLPYGFTSGIVSLVRMLPAHLKSFYTWIGLTDRTSSGQYKYFWLNGDREQWLSAISCRSSGTYYVCLNYERCASIYDKILSFDTVHMDSCSERNNYACSMPPGGTSLYYRIPEDTSATVRPPVAPTASSTAWIWGVVIGSIFASVLLMAGVCSYAQSSNSRRRAAGATTVVVSNGRVVRPSPPPSGPQQRSATQQQQQYLMPSVANAPPSYAEAIAGGYGNPGFQGNK